MIAVLLAGNLAAQVAGPAPQRTGGQQPEQPAPVQAPPAQAPAGAPPAAQAPPGQQVTVAAPPRLTDTGGFLLNNVSLVAAPRDQILSATLNSCDN